MPHVKSTLTQQQKAQLLDVFPGIEHLSGRIAPRSLAEYRRDVQYYLEFCDWNTERARNPYSLRMWLSHMVDHTTLSPNTINRRLISIKAMVQASAAIDQFDHGVAYRFRLVERVKTSALRHRLNPNARTRLSPQDVREMIHLSDPLTLIGLRDRAMLYTLASSGCRISEVVTLRRSDIVRQGDNWMVEVIGKGKHEARRAPLSLEAYEAIQVWLEARALPVASPMIFTRCGNRDDRRQAITSSGAWRRVRLIADAAGLETVTPHSLRRFVGTQISEKHGLRVAQKVLGHVSVETTAAHYVLDDLASGLTEDLF